MMKHPTFLHRVSKQILRVLDGFPVEKPVAEKPENFSDPRLETKRGRPAKIENESGE